MSLQVSIGAIVIGMFCEASAFQDKRIEYGPFSICTPKGFAITKKTPVEDFDLYEIRRNDTLFVLIYASNAPGYPSRNEQKYVATESKLGNVEITSYWNGNRLKRKELLVRERLLSTCEHYFEATQTDGSFLGTRRQTPPTYKIDNYPVCSFS